MEQTQIVHPFP